jgi:DUF971 family protein
MNITDILLLQKEHKLHVTFADGTKISFPCSYLRACSPSAEVTQNQDPAVNIDTIEPIGNYALKFHFDDGHQSGIYTFEYLHTLMQKFKTLEEPLCA